MCMQSLEDMCKKDESWCYKWSDMYLYEIVFKRHMHNKHKLEKYPAMYIMLYGAGKQSSSAKEPS